MLDIKDDCDATNNPGYTACTDFTSTADMKGQFVNETKMLREGEYCTIEIDASQYVAHVYFVDTTELGVLYNGYVVGEGIEIQQGSS